MPASEPTGRGAAPGTVRVKGAALALAALLLAGCGVGEAGGAAGSAAAAGAAGSAGVVEGTPGAGALGPSRVALATPGPGVARRGGVVDSILPIEEEIRRFRATLEREPTSLAGGAGSREALVRMLVRALEGEDTAAFRVLAVDRAEFGMLYYPHSRYTSMPYELSPSLLWFQIANSSSRGVARGLDRLGGRPLGYLDHSCTGEGEVEGPNRLWGGCTVRRIAESGDTLEGRLFTTILERDGRFKFLSLSNDL